LFGELSFCAKGVDSGVEFVDLILEFMIANDVGSKSPIAELVGSIT